MYRIGGKHMQLTEMPPGNPVTAFSGEIDMATAEAMAAALEPCIRAGGPVTIDLSNVTFMDSTGIYVLMEAAMALGDRGCLIVHGAHDGVAKVLELTQLEAVRQNLHIIDCTVLARAS
jgi:anti-sigma B factor antagonist